MKRNKSSFLLGVAIACFSLQLQAQNFTESQSIHRCFAANRNTTADISNKYGRVQVLRWNKDSVCIDVDFRINSSNLSRINRVKSWISFDIFASGDFITARTVFQSGYSNVINDLVNMAESMVDPSNQVIINYTLQVPEYLNLRITNKYGDLYLDDLSGQVELSLSNGELKANRLEGKSSIELSFANAMIQDIHDGKLISSFSDVQVRNCGQLFLSTKSGKATIDEAQSLRLDSRRDKIRLGKTRITGGTSYFSEIWVDELVTEANLSMRYGSLIIDRVDEGFSLIRLNSEYTDIDLTFDRDASYNLDVTYPSDAFVRLPHDLGKLEEKTTELDHPVRMEYGPVGKNPGRSKVTITVSRKANISLNHR